MDTRTRSERGAHNQTKEKLQGEVADLRQEATATRERAAHLEGQVTALKEHFEVLTVANAKAHQSPGQGTWRETVEGQRPEGRGDRRKPKR